MEQTLAGQQRSAVTHDLTQQRRSGYVRDREWNCFPQFMDVVANLRASTDSSAASGITHAFDTEKPKTCGFRRR